MKVLLIAPYYAPYTEVAAIRMISLSKQLVDQGYEVTVYCYSMEMLKSITDEKFLKATVPEKVHTIPFAVKKSRIPAFADIVYGYRFLDGLKKNIRLEDYDVALCTLGPYYPLQAVPYIAQRLPCMLDFRDLGAINIRPKLANARKQRSGLLTLAQKLFYAALRARERKAVEKAAAISVVSEIDREMMMKVYHIPAEKMILASNGYDEERLSNLARQKKDPKNIVGFVFGKFMYYSAERAVSLLKAADSLRRQGYPVKIKHIGQRFPWIEENLKKYGISPDSYEECGLMDYEEGMSWLGTADFFVVEDTSPDDVGTKIYDYIYFNRPVLAATPPDIPLAQLVRTFANGYVCSSDEEVEQAMKRIAQDRPEKLDETLDPKRYSRKIQNKKIVDKIAELGREQ